MKEGWNDGWESEVVVGLTISKLPVVVEKLGQNRIWLQGEETRMLLYRCKVPCGAERITRYKVSMGR